MVQNLRFRLYTFGRFGGRKPFKKTLFLALAELRLGQGQKKHICGGGEAAPHPTISLQVWKKDG